MFEVGLNVISANHHGRFCIYFTDLSEISAFRESGGVAFNKD